MLQFLRMGSKRTKMIWWVLIVITVVTFLGGFVFLVGVGLDTSLSARSRGDLGTVNGARITRAEFGNAVAEQRQAFLQQTGSDADPDETRALEAQAWRGLVTQQILSAEARRLGLHATDREVMLSLQSSPPPVLVQQQAFQTDGKFDPQKYVAAMRNPDNNWAPFEEMARQQVPLRKLQERLLASLKLSEPELRQAYRDRYEKLGVTVLMIAPDPQATVPAPTDADVERMYQKYRGRFASGPRTQLEVLQVPMQFSEEEVRAAREQVAGLADRARRGEDWNTLVKDYSEGPGAARGGEINRVFQPREFGPMEAKMAALQPGQISEPFQDGPYWLVLKVLARIPDPLSPVPNLRVAQLAIRIRASESSMSEQMVKARKIRDRAARVGLGKAAAENGLATSKTAFYDYSAAPPELTTVPEAADWGLSAKQGAVSHVILGPQEFVIVSAAAQRPGGVPPKEEIAEPLRQVAQQEARVALMRPAVQQVGQAIAAGTRLEDAAKGVAGASVFTVDSLSRAMPDQRLAPAPEVIGAAFAAAPGRTIGPIESLAGWFVVRVNWKAPADPAAFDGVKASITQDVIGRRQQMFFANWLAELRSKAKVQDFRGDGM